MLTIESMGGNQMKPELLNDKGIYNEEGNKLYHEFSAIITPFLAENVGKYRLTDIIYITRAVLELDIAQQTLRARLAEHKAEKEVKNDSQKS